MDAARAMSKHLYQGWAVRISMLAAGAAAGAWCVYRDKKYPVRRSLRFIDYILCIVQDGHFAVIEVNLVDENIDQALPVLGIVDIPL